MSANVDLLQGLRQGKETALKQLYLLFFHALCAFGSHFVRDDAVVADIVQEVFIKVWERRKDFGAIYSLRSFMYLAVRNACLNYNRDNARIKQISISDTLAISCLEEEDCWIVEEEVHRMIEFEIEQLPGAIKKVFYLTLMDKSIQEIAEVLNISENTVRNQRARAREILRSRLKDKMVLLFL
ncbi:sigma-70 family RNA polymerase sigma factor [uncultured Sanguibacteroides sp.]|uniref:RNA polymerase sigma factor n=1 Tax=uncultured Sanguibacteroides sp. TaxID=1635151 RepID=UPI0025EFED5E|nr:sigma-70 family RNA polymerase sigma factor [uncultured Sanguibacteroides sp.]